MVFWPKLISRNNPDRLTASSFVRPGPVGRFFISRFGRILIYGVHGDSLMPADWQHCRAADHGYAHASSRWNCAQRYVFANVSAPRSSFSGQNRPSGRVLVYFFRCAPLPRIPV